MSKNLFFNKCKLSLFFFLNHQWHKIKCFMVFKKQLFKWECMQEVFMWRQFTVRVQWSQDCHLEVKRSITMKRICLNTFYFLYVLCMDLEMHLIRILSLISTKKKKQFNNEKYKFLLYNFVYIIKRNPSYSITKQLLILN